MIDKLNKTLIGKFTWGIALVVGIYFFYSNTSSQYFKADQQFEIIASLRTQNALMHTISKNLTSILNNRMSTIVETRELAKVYKSQGDSISYQINEINHSLLQFDSLRSSLGAKNEGLLQLCDLVLNKRSALKPDRDIIISRIVILTDELNFHLEELISLSINDIQNIKKEHASFHNWSVLFVFFMIVVMWKLWITPLREQSEHLEHKFANWKEHENISKSSKTEAEKLNQKLNVKVAQVKKLQESLELAIAYSNKTQKDKSLIYYNLATDLTEYIKVLNLQKSILENHINISQNENWLTLSNTISQLNSLAGNYFSQAKTGVQNKQQKSIYLSQFMSEILVSLNTGKNTTFNQDADMPQINTDAYLLKRVLLPYLQLITSIEEQQTITYSAKEDGDYCEFKFLGLDKAFEESLASLKDKDISDYSFEEFRLYMASKSIEERGGKYWLQFNHGEKGMLTIYWSL